jgi:hypothetical protein
MAAAAASVFFYIALDPTGIEKTVVVVVFV